jgi:mRNA interferase YafQ
MARRSVNGGRFRRDIKLMERRGKDIEKIKAVMRSLVEERPLPPRNRDHALTGDHVGRRECHIEPDWLLIYKLEPNIIIFERTGTHSDLFG